MPPDIEQEIYRPPGSKLVSEVEDNQIRLGIQGYPFTGKTYSALSFPNPICLSFDRKTNAHAHRSDILVVPFYDGSFVDTIVRRDGLQAPPNRKEALTVWLGTEGAKLTSKQTLIVDGSTGIEESYHIWFRQHPELAITRGGGTNDFIEWRLKNDYFAEVWAALKGVPANVVYICHETPDRDKKGELNGQIRPLLSGQSGDKMGGNFTDWFAMYNADKPTDKDGKIDPVRFKGFKEAFKIDDDTANAWIASTPADHNVIYLWQTQADELRKCGSSSLAHQPKFILADFKTFRKYQKQNKLQSNANTNH